MSARLRGIVLTALEVTVPIAVLVAWGLWSANSHSFYFPPLTKILETFNDTWIFERVDADVVPSLVRMWSGFGIAVAAGVGGGMLLGLSRRTRRATQPMVEFLRAIPPPALLPFAILVLGVDDSMKIFIIAFSCLWPILLNTIDGVSGVEPMLRETARAYQISRRDRLLRVTLPAASPQIIAGMRTAVSLALIVMVISEMVATTNGVGYFVLQSQRTFAVPEMWSGILLLGILGYVFNSFFVLIERRLMRWHRGWRASALS